LDLLSWVKDIRLPEKTLQQSTNKSKKANSKAAATPQKKVISRREEREKTRQFYEMLGKENKATKENIPPLKTPIQKILKEQREAITARSATRLPQQAHD